VLHDKRCFVSFPKRNGRELHLCRLFPFLCSRIWLLRRTQGCCCPCTPIEGLLLQNGGSSDEPLDPVVAEKVNLRLVVLGEIVPKK
jgi:hypothetical protein